MTRSRGRSPGLAGPGPPPPASHHTIRRAVRLDSHRGASAALLLLACNEPAAPITPYDRIAGECTLEAPDGGPPVSGEGIVQPITRACATTVGLVYDFDWASFGEEPHAFTTPLTPSEVVIGAMIIVMGTENVPISDTLVDSAPSKLGARLGHFQGESGLAAESDSGRLWSEFLLWAFDDGVTYTGSTSYAMRFYHGNLGVGDVADLHDDTGLISPTSDPTDFVVAAGELAHEAGHDDYGGHVACPGAEEDAIPECDDTPEGAYGVGGWWLWQWLIANPGRLESDSCWNAQRRLEDDCGRILDPGDFPPCADVSDLCAASY